MASDAHGNGSPVQMSGVLKFYDGLQPGFSPVVNLF
jgi:hypothetical protein